VPWGERASPAALATNNKADSRNPLDLGRELTVLLEV